MTALEACDAVKVPKVRQAVVWSGSSVETGEPTVASNPREPAVATDPRESTVAASSPREPAAASDSREPAVTTDPLVAVAADRGRLVSLQPRSRRNGAEFQRFLTAFSVRPASLEETSVHF